MKTLLNTQTKFLTLMLIALIGLSSCKKLEQEEPVQGDAKIRVVNTIVGSTPQDIYQNDTKISTSAIAYGQNTAYLTIKGGVSSTISLKNEGTQVVSASTIASPYADVSYTLFYYSNANGSGAFAGFADENSVVPAGKARVRFMNLGAVLINNVNISVVGGGSLTNGLAYGYLSAYNNIDANTSLNVSVIGTTDATVIPGAQFEAGKIYTVWFDAANTTTVNYHVVAQN
ncbi:DUF4397 domain-containing protein [Pedobacter sp. UC225_65]|uniref:DUF4397 domain-containing protein n=1 Tax=Pedobacter sp. UC225_65 TaxID=3350173 RepID=UPI00366C8449